MPFIATKRDNAHCVCVHLCTMRVHLYIVDCSFFYFLSRIFNENMMNNNVIFNKGNNTCYFWTRKRKKNVFLLRLFSVTCGDFSTGSDPEGVAWRFWYNYCALLLCQTRFPTHTIVLLAHSVASLHWLKLHCTILAEFLQDEGLDAIGC